MRCDPYAARGLDDQRRCGRLLAGEVRHADEWTGWFLEQCAARGFFDNSIIVIVSDHGDALWERGLFGHTNNAYHVTLHVPMLIRLPGAAPAAGRIPQLVSTTDVFATLCELANLTAGVPASSHSLTALMGLRDGVYEREHVYSQMVLPLPGKPLRHEQTFRALYRWPWKLEASNTAEAAAAAERGETLPLEPPDTSFDYNLFDVESDPLEQQPMQDMRPDIARALRQALRTHVEAGRAERKQRFPHLVEEADPARPVRTREQQEALDAIGYF